MLDATQTRSIKIGNVEEVRFAENAGRRWDNVILCPLARWEFSTAGFFHFMLDRRRSKVPKHDWRKFFERLLQLCADGSRSGYYWNWRWSKLPQKLTIVSQMDVWSSILFLVSFESPILKFQRCRSCSYESSPSKVEGVWKPMTQWQPLKTRREESRRNSQQVIFSGLRLASDLGATIGYRLSLVLRHTHILNLFRCRMHTDTCISISIYIYTVYMQLLQKIWLLIRP